MTLFHVRISVAGETYDEVKLDLPFEQLEQQFLAPYREGRPITVNGRAIDPQSLERIRISKSEHSARDFIPRIKADDAASPVAVFGGPSYDARAAARAEDVTDELVTGPPGSSAESNSREPHAPEAESRDVFVVHGRDHAMKEAVARLITALGYNPVILHEKPHSGRTLIEKLIGETTAVAFAVVLLTPDDIGGLGADPSALAPRARQNVVFEFGYLVGHLGRRRVVALLVGDNIERPTDLDGVGYIPVADLTNDTWRISLAREMRAAGLEVDLNLL